MDNKTLIIDCFLCGLAGGFLAFSLLFIFAYWYLKQEAMKYYKASKTFQIGLRLNALTQELVWIKLQLDKMTRNKDA